MPGTKPSKPWWSSSYGSFNGLCSALWETLFISHSIKPLQSAHTHSLTVTWGWFLDYGNLIRCTEQSRSRMARSLAGEELPQQCTTVTAPYNKCSLDCLSRCSKGMLLWSLHTQHRWMIPHRVIRKVTLEVKERALPPNNGCKHWGEASCILWLETHRTGCARIKRKSLKSHFNWLSRGH